MPRDSRQYLEDILEAGQRVEMYLRGMTEDAFRLDARTIDAVVRNLEIVGEAIKRVPEPVRARHPEVEWRRIAAMRDVLAHAYFTVDLAIVWEAAVRKLPELRTQIAKLLASGEAL
ncbi:MAG: DUF86 domain-containing protein [Planctomycetes bacterium]|nr:DUF86 domain-containing protein [Planctomycetota bacterium]